MYNDPLRPRWRRFLLVDPIALLSGLALLAAWGLLLPTAHLGHLPLGIGQITFSPNELALMRRLAGIFTLVGLPLWLLRVRFFRQVLAHSLENWGEVTRIDTYWWGRRVQFYYFCQGAKLHGQNFSLRTRAVMKLATADPVLIVFDQFEPGRSLMMDLFV